MPAYFFDIHDGAELRDDEGTNLPSVVEARAHALQVAAAYVGKPFREGPDKGAVVVSVRDQAGRPALVVRLAFTVDVLQF